MVILLCRNKSLLSREGYKVERSIPTYNKKETQILAGRIWLVCTDKVKADPLWLS